jgi:hypothetical protein
LCFQAVQKFLPHPPIETPVLNRFGKMLFADMLGAFKIGNRPRDLEDATVTAGGEAEALGDEFEEAMAGFVRLAMLANQARRHLGVAVDAAGVESLFLNGAAGFDTTGDDLGGFGVGAVDEIAVFDRRDLDLDVDAVEQGAGDLGAVALDDYGGAGTGVGRVGKIAAGAALCVLFPTFSMNSVLVITSQFH